MDTTFSTTPIHTWKTSEGELSVYEEQGQHKFCLITKTSQRVNIPNTEIDGIFPDIESQKIRDICKQYLPVI